MNNEAPLVTVVTVTYNLLLGGREQTMKQCIESVNNQTYKEIEHLIIDGASTDGTIDFLHIYEEQGWVKVFSDPDDGVYYAMNKGLEKANGKYIAYLNSDDFYHEKDAVEDAVRVLEETDAEYVFGNMICLYDDGTKMKVPADILQIPFGMNYCHQACFVKTKILRELNGFNTSYKIASDADLKIRLFKEGYRYKWIDMPLVTYRMGGLSFQQQELGCAEYDNSFYMNIGKDIGLSQDECMGLCGMKFLQTQSYKVQMKILIKLCRRFSIKAPIINMIKRNKLAFRIINKIKRCVRKVSA